MLFQIRVLLQRIIIDRILKMLVWLTVVLPRMILNSSIVFINWPMEASRLFNNVLEITVAVTTNVVIIHGRFPIHFSVTVVVFQGPEIWMGCCFDCYFLYYRHHCCDYLVLRMAGESITR